MLKKRKQKTTKNASPRFFIEYPKGKQWQSIVRGVSYRNIAARVMGASYTLSVIFTTPKKIERLNRLYRKKNSSTDILSFTLSKSEGELYISMKDVVKKAPLFYLPPKEYFEYLFIHGLVHLKGMDHGRTMDAAEKKYCKLFGFSYPH